MRESEVAQSCLILSDPMDCSPPGSSVHGIFQARVLEWDAIAFSKWPPTRPQKHLGSSKPIRSKEHLAQMVTNLPKMQESRV